MYIVSLTYTAPLETVDSHLDAHVAFLKKHYSLGNFLASGRKGPRTGGVILANAASRTQLDDIVKEDPFYIHAVASYEITEFVASMTCQEMNFIQNK